MIRLPFARSIKIAVAGTVVVLAATSLAYGNSGGIFGRSMPGNTCSACHSGGTFTANLQIAGPARVEVDIETDFTVTLTSSSGTPSGGGFNLSTNNGELFPGS